MAAIPITRVRYGDQESAVLLRSFVFEGRYGGARTPRGVEPAFVARFIRDNLQPGSSPESYAAVLELIRFYERPDVLPYLRAALTGHESNSTDVLRSLYVLQAIGDLGSPNEAIQAADYFDRVLVPYRYLNARLYPLFLDTLVSFAPAGSANRLLQRISFDLQELARSRYAGESGMMQYDALAAIQRNNVPKTTIVITIKNRLAAQSAAERRAELVRVYLGLSTGGALLSTWAARLLRREALESSPQPVYAEFARGIDAVDENELGIDRARFVIRRAAQAILYLGGAIPPPQLGKVWDLTSGRGNFLWDE